MHMDVREEKWKGFFSSFFFQNLNKIEIRKVGFLLFFLITFLNLIAVMCQILAMSRSRMCFNYRVTVRCTLAESAVSLCNQNSLALHIVRSPPPPPNPCCGFQQSCKDKVHPSIRRRVYRDHCLSVTELVRRLQSGPEQEVYLRLTGEGHPTDGETAKHPLPAHHIDLPQPPATEQLVFE